MKPDVNIPTDNMYKFFAIGGLTLFIASLILSSLVSTSRMKFNIELYTEATNQQARADTLQLTLRGLDQKSEVPSEVQKDIFNLKAQTENLTFRQRAEDALNSKIVILLNTSVWLGLGMSVAGFALWYFKLQRYEDADLKSRTQNTKRAK